MQLTVAVVLSAGATLAAVVLAGVVARDRDPAGARALVVFNLGVAVWTGGNAFQAAATTLPGKLLWVDVQYVGIAVVPVAWFAFACQYTGRGEWVTPRRLAVLAVPMAALAVVSWTAPELVRASATLSGTTPVRLERTFGIAFWAGWLYSAALNVTSTTLLVVHVARTSSVFRVQAAAILVGALVPWAAHFAYIGGVLALEPEPFFAVTGAAFALAITRYRFLDLSPVARNALVERTADAMFVCDDGGRLIDVNPAGVALLERDRESLLGVRAADALERVPEVAACCGGARIDADGTERARNPQFGADGDEATVFGRQTLPVDGETRHFDVRASTLSSGETLVVLHEVTALVERERALERQNERLETVAGTLSHDLRNPLTVAKGHVELARETDDVSTLEGAEEGLERMEAIVDDVLALARTGEPDDVESQSVADGARDAWATVDTDEATLRVETSATVAADAGHLQQLFENLFRNAIEHADADVVSVGTLADETGFYVDDDGPGIPDAVAASLFERGTTTQGDGTGFGLAIVERVADAHGWTVRATENETGGARFEVRTGN